jgi:hypothetical protein
MVGTTLCALGDFAANPILATIKHFPDEFKAYVSKQSVPEKAAPAAKKTAAAAGD